MMNNEAINPIRTTSYVDLDMTIEAEDVEQIVAEAREYAIGFARLPARTFTVAVVSTAGPDHPGQWPVVRFMAEHIWLKQLVEVYGAEAEGVV